MHRLLLRAALLALGAILLVPVASAQAGGQKGLNIAGYDDVPAALNAGAQQVRMFALWNQLEPDGPSDFTKAGPAHPNPVYDALSSAIAKTLAGGATPIVVVLDTPAWASPTGAAGRTHPARAQDYANFFGDLLAAEAKLVPAGRTIAYEVWNEEDAAEFWGGSPDPDLYASMLKASYAAGKAGDPSATILMGPTTGNNYAWVQSMYDRDARGAFDGVAVHTDTACLDRGPAQFYRDPNPQDPRGQGPLGQFTFLGYRTVHDVMVANGDDKPIWMTELGWSSTGGSATSCARGANAGKKPSGVSTADQARYLTQAYACMAQDPYVVGGAWFTLRDTTSIAIDELNHYGLLSPVGVAKPVLQAFKAVDPTKAGDCGDFTPPAIEVQQLGSGGMSSGALPVRVQATDAGVGMGGPNSRITFQVDDDPALKINFTAAGTKTKLGTDGVAAYTFTGTKKLPLGLHTLHVYALDDNQNLTRRDVTFTRVTRLQQTVPSAVTVRSPRCHGVTCTVAGKTSASGGVDEGKVQVVWSWRSKTGFKVLHKAMKNANKPFAFTQRLRKKGKWRVVVKYLGGGAIRASTSSTRTFTAR